MKFKEIVIELIEHASGIEGLTGPEKLDFVCDQLVKLDNATILKLIPDEVESMVLQFVVQKIYNEVKEHLN